MKDYFLRLFKFNEWANVRLSAMIRTVEKDCPADALLLYNHVGQAGSVWLNRLKGQTPLTSVWEVHPLEEADKLLLLNSKEWIEFIQTSANVFEGAIEYKNTQGTAFLNNKVDILAHVVNHNTYHRGQIIKMIKPILGDSYKISSTDFITFARENPISKF
jgi:uncharacterized damage-inducible protein DinB